jgi:hypothetical protein
LDTIRIVKAAFFPNQLKCWDFGYRRPILPLKIFPKSWLRQGNAGGGTVICTSAVSKKKFYVSPIYFESESVPNNLISQPLISQLNI